MTTTPAYSCRADADGASPTFEVRQDRTVKWAFLWIAQQMATWAESWFSKDGRAGASEVRQPLAFTFGLDPCAVDQEV